MTILLIEDDPTTRFSVELMLRRANREVDSAETGEEGLQRACEGRFELILLDLGLPDIDGIDVLRRLRLAQVATPVLVLTGNDEDTRMIAAFDEGATDFLPKPFHAEGLIACIETIGRRMAGQAHVLVKAGPLEVNLKAGTAAVNGRPVALAPREWEMLALLARRKGVTLTKEMFLDEVWRGVETELKTIDATICKLRRKLSRAAGGESPIFTVWGRGYVLQDPRQVSEAVAA